MVSLRTGAVRARWDPSLHLYRVSGRPVIWAYWDGVELPAFLRLALASVSCHNRRHFRLQLVRSADLALWLDHLHPAFDFLRPAHQANTLWDNHSR